MGVGAKKWKHARCASMDEQINEIRCLHTLGYYSAQRKSESLTHATAWMNLEDIMLSETSQTPKRTNIVWFHSYETLKVVTFKETESRIVLIRGGNGELLSNEYEVSVGEDENVPEMGSDEDRTVI